MKKSSKKYYWTISMGKIWKGCEKKNNNSNRKTGIPYKTDGDSTMIKAVIFHIIITKLHNNRTQVRRKEARDLQISKTTRRYLWPDSWKNHNLYILLAVLRIRDILERILIRESVPLTYGSGSWHFRYWPSRHQEKTIFCLLRYFLKIHLHHILKIKSHKKVTKQ